MPGRLIRGITGGLTYPCRGEVEVGQRVELGAQLLKQLAYLLVLLI